MTGDQIAFVAVSFGAAVIFTAMLIGYLVDTAARTIAGKDDGVSVDMVVVAAVAIGICAAIPLGIILDATVRVAP